MYDPKPDENFVYYRCFFDPVEDHKLSGIYMSDRHRTIPFAKRAEESGAFKSEDAFVGFANTILGEIYEDDFATENRTFSITKTDSHSEGGFQIEHRKYLDAYKTNAFSYSKAVYMKNGDEQVNHIRAHL